MPLLKLDNLSLAYGQQVLFDSIQLLLNKGDRLCLVGRNGVGKSTLLKVIEGFVESDGGSRWLDTAVKVAGLSQDLPEANDERVLDFVASGLAQLGQDLAQYQRCIEAPDTDLNLLAQLQSRIEAVDGWSLQNRIEQVLSRLELNAQDRLADLSGGWRRRAAPGATLPTRCSTRWRWRSRTSARLVAASTMTLVSASKPSISGISTPKHRQTYRSAAKLLGSIVRPDI